jgi:hypothetical protein
VIIDGGNRVVGAGGDATAPFIIVGSGVTLTLRNITLRAENHNAEHDPVVRVEAGGTLILEEGAYIRGHTNIDGDGGGVVVKGTFIMKGGEISGNSTTGGNTGGGVYVAAGGVFTMMGGAVSGNTSPGNGGAVYVAGGGTFTMQGGSLSGNTSLDSGGGVYVAGPAGGGLGGTFTMQGGTIGGNKANTGGGVYAATDGFFAKSLGTIYGAGAVSGSGAANANSAGTNNGHAAYAQDGPRERNATAGPGVSLNSGTNPNWEYPALTGYWTPGNLASAAQVDWYSISAVSAGTYQLRWDDSGDGEGSSTGKADITVAAYRANGTSILPLYRDDHGYNHSSAPPPFELAAGETVLVKVVVKAGSNVTGTYKILCQVTPTLSASWTDGTLAAGTSAWYRFRPGTAGTYQIQWEDSGDNSGSGGSYANIKAAAFRSATYYDGAILDPYKIVFGGSGGGIDNGYTDPPDPIDLAEEELIYVVVSGVTGSYRIRGYQCEEGTIAAAATQWHTFLVGTSGTYSLQWEDQVHQASGKKTPYTGVINKVSAYRGQVPLFVDQNLGYPTPKSLGRLNAGETVSVKVEGGTPGGTYIVRCYR